ncbi:Phospholipase D1 [Coemansia asiatica]|uniref:Phospholipase D1 n=1 Tax=Coemansia asiatica TaxID=1052880 RepID=A0A9W7XJS2_9FUNG|nr:Phospholipase D1 [Coemansia asiatica]
MVSAAALLFLAAAEAAPGTKICAAQNILTNCLSVQGIQFTACSYSDWACKCQAQKALVQCYNNCPGDDARAAQEGQVTVYCNAAMREEEQKSRASSSTAKHKETASVEKSMATTNVEEETDGGLPRTVNGEKPGRKGSKRRASGGSKVSVNMDSAGAATLAQSAWSVALLSAGSAIALLAI